MDFTHKGDMRMRLGLYAKWYCTNHDRSYNVHHIHIYMLTHVEVRCMIGSTLRPICLIIQVTKSICRTSLDSSRHAR